MLKTTAAGRKISGILGGRMLVRGIAFGFSLLFATAAFSQEVQRADTSSRRVTSAGQLTACSVEFTIAFRDQAYRSGATSAVTGSLTWNATPKAGIVMMLKVLGADFDANFRPAGEIVVSYSFVQGLQKSYHAETKFGCDRPSGFCGAYSAAQSLDLMEQALAGGLSVGFNRRVKGMDIVLPVRLAAAAQENFSRCALELIDVQKRMLGER